MCRRLLQPYGDISTAARVHGAVLLGFASVREYDFRDEVHAAC